MRPVAVPGPRTESLHGMAPPRRGLERSSQKKQRGSPG